MPTMNTMTSAPAEQFDDLDQQLRADVMGMWVFLATEMLLFGSLLTGFVIFRIQHAAVFADAASHLGLKLGSINTAILLTSGLTVALSEQAVSSGRRRSAFSLLLISIVLGVTFLCIKFYEWYIEYTEELMPVLGLPFRFKGEHDHVAELFFNFYYMMTGLHAVHMIAGLGVLMVILMQIARWSEPGRVTRQARIGGLYWHFVDVIWVFIFTLLYLLRS
ncbi:MAG: cytochrome c oxidase subunit 3 [Nitrococcus sp.]|nr:cytochrome c oxidase subunit 3 [Nitrococcus sp.]